MRLALLLLALSVPSCGGDTAPASGSSSAPATCRDAAYREDAVLDVQCSEHANIERKDGWILCRCNPASPTGGT